MKCQILFSGENKKNIIINLLKILPSVLSIKQEMKTVYIILQDEECLRPGDVTDQTFLDKLCETIGKHAHFLSHSVADNSARKTIQRDVSLRFCFGFCVNKEKLSVTILELFLTHLA